MFTTCTHKSLTAPAVNISDAIKRQYAAGTGADMNCLLQDRAYKEQHPPALTTFFQGQLRQRPRLPEEHFPDMLLITGIRGEAPVAILSHLLPDSRLLEVRVQAGEEHVEFAEGTTAVTAIATETRTTKVAKRQAEFETLRLPSLPCLRQCHNRKRDRDKVCRTLSAPLFHEDLQRLANTVRALRRQ